MRIGTIKILSWANLDQNLFSNVKPSGDIVGKVDKGVAKELGLGKSVIAVTGGHDQPCGALGAGILSELIIERASTEPASIFILPHFVGSGTPTMDSRSKGAILGLTLDTTKADLSKAVLDSLCYEMRINLDTLKGIGVDVEEIRIIGGGAKSKIWSQLKANI